MQVDAALWRPRTVPKPPVIIVLDFLGPLGLGLRGFPIDSGARVFVPAHLGGGKELHSGLVGTMPNRVPVRYLTNSGYAVLVSCYGSWAPDCPVMSHHVGAAPLMQSKAGAIALWAWAYRVLVRAADNLLNASRCIVAGHSRLGKAALWAAALDDRIDAVFANQSGCFGAAPASHPEGETPDQLIAQFPHWTIAHKRAKRDVDQHHLLALIAPRILYLGQASGDQWADPRGSVVALKAARATWPTDVQHRVGYHMRDGGHDLTKEDWSSFLGFLDTTDSR